MAHSEVRWPGLAEALDPELAFNVARFGALLDALPWAWPDRGTDAFARACELTGQSGPPAGMPGVAPFVTVQPVSDELCGTLWILCAGQRVYEAFVAAAPRLGLRPGRLEQAAREACVCAGRAAIAAAPLQQKCVDGAADVEPVALPLMTVRLGGKGRLSEHARDPDFVDYGSLGAAWALALVSHWLDKPVPPNMVVSAAVGAGGELLEVGGLDAKWRLVDSLLSPETVLITARASSSEMLKRDGGRVQELSGLDDLVRYVFPDNRDVLRRWVATLGEPGDLVRQLERLILEEQRCGLGWPALERSARLAMDLDEVGGAERAMLRTLALVCRRHLGARDPLGGTEVAALRAASLPRERWLRYVAHLAQHNADTGTPPLDLLREDMRKYMLGSQVRDLSLHERRCLGAWARAQGIEGDPREHLARQRELAEAHLEVGSYLEVSFPLTLWFRLAGAVEDRASFEAAMQLRERVAGMSGGESESGDGALFVDQAQWMGACLLRAPELRPMVQGEARRERPRKPQLMLAVARLDLLEALRLGGNADAVEAACSQLVAQVSPFLKAEREDRGPVPERTLLLAALDLLAEGRDPASTPIAEPLYVLAGMHGGADVGAPSEPGRTPLRTRAILDLFEAVEPEPMRRVRRAEEREGRCAAELADAVRRRYPY